MQNTPRPRPTNVTRARSLAAGRYVALPCSVPADRNAALPALAAGSMVRVLSAESGSALVSVLYRCPMTSKVRSANILRNATVRVAA